MASNPQIAEQEPINAPKPMQGKYDKRGKHKRTKGIANGVKRNGRKPHWFKTLDRNKAARTAQEFDSIASPAEIYRLAFEANKLELCWSMREYVDNRLFGKPFVAINPAESKQSATLHQDNRLQVAIQQLVVTGKRAKGKKAKQIEALNAAPEEPSTDDVVQASDWQDTQVVDSEAPEPS